MSLPPLPSVRDLIKLYRLRALKQMSQNFLLDTRITDKIVRAAGGPKFLKDAEVCEVGPGPGPITRSILNAGVKNLIVIEKDDRFIPTLKMLSSAAPGRLNIILGDVLTVDMGHLLSKDHALPWDSDPPNLHIIGNLPFNVATPLIIRWLHDISERRNAWSLGRVRMTLTFQEEVAQRMVARESQEMRCRLSVMCQSWCHLSHKFTISGSSFVPKPDVNVGVVHLVPRVNPLMNAPFKIVEKVVRNVFSMRQKYCVRGAETLFPLAVRSKMTSELFSKSNLRPDIRAYQLHNTEFSRLVDVYWDMCQNNPGLYEYNHRAPLAERGEADWNVDQQLVEGLA